MPLSLNQKLQRLTAGPSSRSLRGMRRGLEKESLRVQPDGHLARTEHPQALGSALTHPWITTDYSEALMEFITPALGSIGETLQFLDNLHRFTYAHLGDEMLWANSMPCILGEDTSIPLARYGSSNIGKLKTLYREGLGHRYGRRMQTIAGIHYNLSFPDEFWKELQEMQGDTRPLQEFISAGYFGLIRNFQRLSWLLLYLLGASPASCATFLKGRDHQLQLRAHNTLYMPQATSLRMSNVGYQSSAQASLRVSCNSVEEYTRDLSAAIRTPHPAFQSIGVKENGEWKQISDSMLQIENEFYGLIRPKRTTKRYERPTTALRERGVEYIEMRCVDLNPFTPLGIDSRSAHFLETFALYCLLCDSPDLTNEESRLLPENQQRMVLFGRDPDLTLNDRHGEFVFRDRARQMLGDMAQVADLLDAAYETRAYSASIRIEQDKIEDAEGCYSSQVLASMDRDDQSFFGFAMQMTEAHARHFREQTLAAPTQEEFESTAEQSLTDQQEIEASDNLVFDEFVARYLAE